MRAFEAVLFLVSLIVLLVKAGVTKSMHVSECTILGGLREFVLHIVQDSIMLFWAVVMFINVNSIKGASIIDIHNRRINKTSKLKYAAALICSALIILLNGLTLKFNISMCQGDNYKIIKQAIKSKQEYVSMYTHWLLTLCNMTTFVVAMMAGCYTLYSTYKK